MGQRNTLHPNTAWLIAWWERLAPIVNGSWGLQRDLCQDLAYRMGEAGNDDPSDAAIVEAARWEEAIGNGEHPWNPPEEEA